VPLGSIGKKEVIVLEMSNGGGGLSKKDLSPRASLMYRASQYKSRYLKKVVRKFPD
jgi:hypothetical protein